MNTSTGSVSASHRPVRPRRIAALAVVGALAVASCGQGVAARDSTRTAGPGAGGSNSPTSWTGARLLVAGSDALVLQADRLLRARDGATISAAVPGGEERAVVFSGQDGVLATLAGDVAQAFTTTDGGSSWRETGSASLSRFAAAGLTGMSVARRGDTLLAVVRQASSAAFSSAVSAVSSDGGRSWSVGQAPVAGTVTAAGGAFWLVGGTSNASVYTSADGVSWQPVTLPATATDWSAAAAVDVPGTGVVIPVTSRPAPDSSTLTFDVTTDGGTTWMPAGTVVVGSATGPGTTVPAYIAADGRWLAAEQDGSRFYRGALGQAGVETVSPNGLAGGVVDLVAPALPEAVVLTAVSDCPQGKDSCRSDTRLFTTSDGGQTWSAPPAG